MMASGMGCPSIGIYSYELFNFYGVKNIIRVGSAGAISPKLKLKDIVVAMSAYTDSGYISSFGFRGNVAPCCSYELLAKAMENAKELPCNVVCGPIFSSDAFYSDVSQTETLSGSVKNYRNYAFILVGLAAILAIVLAALLLIRPPKNKA